jgi:hypothetical protein
VVELAHGTTWRDIGISAELIPGLG